MHSWFGICQAAPPFNPELLGESKKYLAKSIKISGLYGTVPNTHMSNQENIQKKYCRVIRHEGEME